MPALTSAPARRLPARTSPSDHLRLSWWQCARTTRPLHARWADPRRRVSRQTRAMAGATENYSIWLVPQGPLAERLQAEIDALRGRVPGAPHFVPHVTLIPDVKPPLEQLLATAERLAAQLTPYRIDFDKVAVGSIFHQCVYILCKAEEETMAAGSAARRAYGMDPNARYMPHLSLLYSDISQEEREALAAELQAKLLAGGPEALGERGFTAAALQVWSTPVEDRSLESWRLVKEFPLSRGSTE